MANGFSTPPQKPKFQRQSFRDKSLADRIGFFLGPHLAESARNIGSLARSGLEFLSPAGDISDLVSAARDTSRSAIEGSPAGVLSGAGMMGASILGAALPVPPPKKMRQAFERLAEASDPANPVFIKTLKEARGLLDNAGFKEVGHGRDLSGRGRGIDPNSFIFESGRSMVLVRKVPFKGYKIRAWLGSELQETLK